MAGTAANWPIDLTGDVVEMETLPTSLGSPARIISDAGLTPPCFCVHLWEPPEKRYAHIAPVFRDHLDKLPGLFQEVLESMFPSFLASGLAWLSQLLLCRVYDSEEMCELRGIAKASGVPIHLLVAFNVLLDLFMGCTSGGVRVRDSNPAATGSATVKDNTKMLHFRALDWGMDELRKLVIVLEFQAERDGPIIARSVTYFGYVGVLTGVRPGLSLSLNFRPHHDTSTTSKTMSYILHLVLVLFGFRRSISSVLRQCLLPRSGTAMDLNTLAEHFDKQKSTAAYLIFSDGEETISIEKDNGSSTIARDRNMIMTLNHDQLDENAPSRLEKSVNAEAKTMATMGMEELVAFSIERKQCAVEFYNNAMSWRREHGYRDVLLEEEEIVAWMEGNRVVNEETHYAVIMDPKTGEIIWLQRWLEPFKYDECRRKRRQAQAKWQEKARNRIETRAANSEK